MNASPRVFWTGLAIAVIAALVIWWLTGTGWGAALLMGYVRVMFVPSRFHGRSMAGLRRASRQAPGRAAKASATPMR